MRVNDFVATLAEWIPGWLAVVLVLWLICGVIAYFWIKSEQETRSWYDDEYDCWHSVPRKATPTEVRWRNLFSLLGPIAFILLSLKAANSV